VEAGALHALDAPAWEAAWARRGSALGLDEYVRGELRKLNKATLDGTRLDLTLVVNHQEEVAERVPFTKYGPITVRALVTDATCAFDHPARYRVQHDAVREVVSFTPTYAGQVEAGEMLEASGWLESDAVGARRVVVGTSREGEGEFVKNVSGERARSQLPA
jgi:predicted nucleotidyltransferase